MYIEDLINAGLKEKEALIYNLLLPAQEMPVNEIIKLSKLKRGIVYKTLYDLEEKGLVKEVKLRKKLHFKAEHPFKLSEIVDEKFKEAQKNQLSLSSILPLLITTYKSSENKPGVKIYEGLEGVKEVYMDTLNTNQTIHAVIETASFDKDFQKWLDEYYAPERAKRKIWAQVIVNDGKNSKSYIDRNEKEFRETKVVSRKNFSIGSEVNLYGGKIAFIHFDEKKENLFGIIIENPLIYKTVKTMFDLAWDSVKN